MLRANPVPVFGKDGKQKIQFFIVLSLISCTLLWQGCTAVSRSTASPAQTTTPQVGKQVLPSSSVGSSYVQVLTATPLEALRISQGQLPPGLQLNPATGVLSGTPTQAGTFAFTVTATMGSPGVLTSTIYTLTVNAVSNRITVEVSPTSASTPAGGNVQFSASVKNTSNTAVSWSASAGTISRSGLWTAPSSTATQNITITATSAADPAVRSSATATLVNAAFRILTGSLPSAVAAVPYSASLTAAGGQVPYQWTVVSGSMPAGLKLDSSSGVVSGSPTTAGTYSFVVQGADSAQQKSQQNYTLTVSTGGDSCGPPTYRCSRTDTAVVQIPSQVPAVGNLYGANKIVTDPDFSNRIVRITDWNTDPAAQTNNRSYVSATSGSADENLWNTDSTMFVVQALGTTGYPYTFDPATMQAQRMYVSSNASHGGFTLPGGGMWSRVSAHLLYTVGDSTPTISKYDFSDRTNAPSPQPVYDFRSSANCLPAGFTQSWKTKGGVSAGDAVFGMGYSNTGTQDTGAYAVVYKVGSGCSVLNTQTGQVWGDWGAKGSIDIPDRWTIHNVKISKDGNWLVITAANCLIAACSYSPYFWEVGTTHVTSCGDGLTSGQRCGGHFTEGYSHWVNTYDAGLYTTRPFSDPRAIFYLTPNRPAGVQDPLDEHASWNNADPADSYPFFLSYWSLTTPFPGPWYNEITGLAPDGSGKVWRFAHSFITTKSQIFSTQYAIGSVSQDGRFFILSSDWMGTLGSQSGNPSCTVGTDCRGDVFVIELK